MKSEFTSSPTPDHYFIALMDNGVPKFSESPRAHASIHAAEREVERLAKLHPGKKFAYFELVSTAVSYEPRITGKDLKTTAKVGVYKCTTDGHSASRFVVMDNDGYRCVLFVGFRGHVAPVSNLWDDDTFEKVGEDLKLKPVRG